MIIGTLGTSGTLVLLAVLACLAMLTTDGDGDGEGDGEGTTSGRGRPDSGGEGELSEDAQKLLDAEKARLRKKAESDLEAERERIREELKAEAEEEARKAQMDETDRLKLEKEQAEKRAEELEKQTQEMETRIQRSDYIAQNAGNLDRAWRTLLDRELADADPDEWDDILARVADEYAETTGGQADIGRKTDPNGSPPDGGGRGDIYTREQLMALTPAEQSANADKVERSLAALE